MATTEIQAAPDSAAAGRSSKAPEERPSLQPAPFYPWVPGDAGPGDVTSPGAAVERTVPEPADVAVASGDPRSALAAGTVLAEEYVLESVVPGGDRGGMGLVFKARDLIKSRAADPYPYVAIKVLNEEFKSHPDSMTALQREFKTSLQLAHPNIVKMQACMQDGIDVFLVMELLEGRSLVDAIDATRGRGLPVAEAHRIVQKLARALGYAHRLRIVHSDFKPGNAFVTHDGTVKVLDFGIARALMQRTSDAQSWKAHTSAYASREQIEGAAPDPRDDVYSLALVAYELYTGRHPFDRRNAVAARNAGLAPRSIPGLSRRQWATLRAALSFDRDQRPPDAHAFGEGMTPVPRRFTLSTPGATVVALLALSSLLVALNAWQQSRAAHLALELMSTDPAVADPAVAQLAMSYRWTRDAVLGGAGAKARVMAIYARQVHAAFDPLREVYDYARARSTLELAKRLLGDYEPLTEYAASLEKQRQLALARLGAAFERALADGTLLDDDGPKSLLAIRRIIAQIGPGDPLLSDPRVPLAFRDAATAAWMRSDLQRADRLVAAGLIFSPSDPALIDVADRVRRTRGLTGQN